MEHEVKELISTSPMAELTDLMDAVAEYWDEIRPDSYQTKVVERLPRGYILDRNGSYTFALDDEVLGMAVIYNKWTSIQSLNRTEASHGDILFLGRQGSYLIYWECKDGKVERMPSEIEGSDKIAPIQLILREKDGAIEILDIGDHKVEIKGRFLVKDEEE